MGQTKTVEQPQALHSPARGTRIPNATYRLQLNSHFTFSDAREIVDYLYKLGISDVYASPVLQAAPGSLHGYDVCDPSRLNPELGSDEDFDRLVHALQARSMGLLVDTVPNHMGIADDCNLWWTDVLENGPISQYAPFFDIEWQPVKPELENRVLLPILENQYGRVLESGTLQLEYADGGFWLCYYERRLPINPRSYGRLLGYKLDALTEELGSDNDDVAELQSILTAISYLPRRWEADPAKVAERNREKEIIKRRIANLYSSSPAMKTAIDESVEAFNGRVGEPDSFTLLEDLIGAQAYRPAFWRVAGDEINYRRFFDINTLAAIRVELPEVFHATHDFVLALAATGKVTGLRIDHPDGLWDPTSYFQQLQAGYREHVELAQGHAEAQLTGADETSRVSESGDGASAPSVRSAVPPLYVVAEKILSETEPLPREWEVHGTTGYDFLALVNGLFVDAGNEKAFNRIYRHFVGPQSSFRDLVVETKMDVMRNALSSEINALAYQLERIAERNRHYRDFTLRGLIHALRDVIAVLPVYRTYINAIDGIVTERDARFVEAAISDALQRNPSTDESVYRFIGDTLLLRSWQDFSDEDRHELAHFVMKFQQLTGPVMAKGGEDTAFYIYNRLVSLNEVGDDPRQFGVSVKEFHRQNARRAENWPHSMLATSTHDNKRSEDVRARINVLSEFPDDWRTALGRWIRINAAHARRIAGKRVPDRNDEYLLYQTLLGVWDAAAPSGTGGPEHDELVERVSAYMGKATMEAKVHTSWINPNDEYDRALSEFVHDILKPGRHQRFLNEFAPLLQRVAYYGRFNALAQVLLKLTAPGVPDIYQGNELWNFSLVDPDNRRPVDYARRRALLDELKGRVEQAQAREASERPGAGLRALAQELVERSEDGRIKLFVTYRTLNFRREQAELFREGAYRALAANGDRAEHVVAFARLAGQRAALTIVPRLVLGLAGESGGPPLGPGAWGDTWLLLPDGLSSAGFRNVFTGESLRTGEREGRAGLPLAELCRDFPVALLVRE